ncbi:hypothetical protein AOLI_G00248050 [Acnodon oligacanthus]
MPSRGRAERCLHRDRRNHSNNFCHFAFVSFFQLQRTSEHLAAVSVPVDDVRRVKEQNKPPLEEQTSETRFLRGP